MDTSREGLGECVWGARRCEGAYRRLQALCLSRWAANPHESYEANWHTGAVVPCLRDTGTAAVGDELEHISAI